MQDPIRSKDSAEAIALYRAQIVGPLVRRELAGTTLARELQELAQVRFRPPHSDKTTTYSVATLERWYYAYQRHGLEALRPKARSDRGRGRQLTEDQKALLVDVRREFPSASVAQILRTLEHDGRIERGSLRAITLRRFFAERGLDKQTLRNVASDGHARLRWQAEKPHALWHGDVCHAAPIVVDGASTPVRIHALLDDASRTVLAIEARHQEREVDMLALMIRALRRFGAPAALYLDNGATYRGETLALACARLGTALIHAKPYDAPARGKMERFWGTMRSQCLTFCEGLTSLHDLNVRLLAWVDEQYHVTPHGGLMGKTPAEVLAAAPDRVDTLDEAKLAEALTVRERRRVRRDNTLAMGGVDWETSLHFLAGRVVTVARSFLDAEQPPWIEHEGKRHGLTAVDAVQNARTPRAKLPQREERERRVDFDPPGALVAQMLGRSARDEARGEADQ